MPCLAQTVRESTDLRRFAQIRTSESAGIRVSYPLLKKKIIRSPKNGGAPMQSIADELIKEGIEKGFEKGIEQTQLQIVEKMILNGISNQDIRKITGVSMSRIEQIRKKSRK